MTRLQCFLQGYRSVLKRTLEMNASPYLLKKTQAFLYPNPWIAENDRLQAIFIHIPRNAGSSVETTLFGRHLSHPLLGTYYAHDAKKTEDYFKFAFVRNPWDRLVSAFHQVKKREVGSWKIWGEFWIAEKTFDEFLRDLENSLFFRTMVLSFPHFRPQWEFVHNNFVSLDYLGYFESLEMGFQEIVERLGLEYLSLPHINASSRGSYTDYYSDWSRDLVAEIYRRDIEYFKYDFGGRRKT